jgi:hypothetical protein
LQETVDYITYPAEIEFSSSSLQKIKDDCKKLATLEKNGLEQIFIRDKLSKRY